MPKARRREGPWLRIAFIAFAPISIPVLLASIAYDNAMYRRKQRKGAGDPPSRPPGKRVGDYIDQYTRLPRQRRKYSKLQKKTTDIEQLPRLSYELCSIIITLLRDDPSALKNCSLVCRAWVFPAHRLLFTNLKPIGHAAYSYLPLLRSPYCTIPRHLHRVDLHDTQFWTTVESVLTALASFNFRIQALHLVLWSPFRHHSRFSSLNVTTLDVIFGGESLKGNRSRPSKSLNAIFASFPHLQSLSMRLLPFYVFHPEIMSPPPQKLKHLSIEAVARTSVFATQTLVDQVLRWFLDPRYSLQLESLGHLCYSNSLTSTYLAEFLKTPRAQGLKSLEVPAMHDYRSWEDPHFPIPLDIYFPPGTTCIPPNLTTLQFRIAPRLSSLRLLTLLRRILPRFPNLKCLALRYSDSDQLRSLVSIPNYGQVQTVFPFCEEHVRGGNELDALERVLKGDVLRMYTGTA